MQMIEGMTNGRMTDVDGTVRHLDIVMSSFVIRTLQGCSSIGRALVSKTSGWEFKSPRPCH